MLRRSRRITPPRRWPRYWVFTLTITKHGTKHGKLAVVRGLDCWTQCRFYSRSGSRSVNRRISDE